jgi:hypothetical protein
MLYENSLREQVKEHCQGISVDCGMPAAFGKIEKALMI